MTLLATPAVPPQTIASGWNRTPSSAPPAPAPNFEPGLLDRIVEPGALTTLFQPIFDLRAPTPSAIAVECLTRGPQGSSLETPDVLFEFARRKHAEAVVDRAAIATALAAAAKLPANLPLHLNVHAATLSSDHSFPSYLERVAAFHGIVASRLTIEIVEHAELADDALLVETLAALRRRGTGIALDDIGHGRSNFRMMLLTKPGLLKVDRYLVQGIAADPIRQTVMAKLHEVASALPAILVAEGIESLEDLAVLRALRIEAGQGYLFAKPLTVEALLDSSLLRPFAGGAGRLGPLPRSA
jgi:EAL domain-containing protein (putative c-di-GMP-specific phosphodiesterase class I)